MKMERLNAWLGLAGNVAILLGLVALAIEINANTKALRVQISENSVALAQEANLAVAGNPDLQALYSKALFRPAELTPAELWGATLYFERTMVNDRRQFDLYKSGVLTESEWQTELSYTPYHWNTPFGQLLWSELKGDYDPEFVAAVDNVLAESEGEPNDEWLRRLHERVTNLEF